jgi:outer membrane murein-binding lipoprotein Lpp
MANDNKNLNQTSAPPASDDVSGLRAEIEALKEQLKQVAFSSPQAQAAAQAEARAEAEKAKVTETIPGGLYMLADGKTLVNANGRKVDSDGKPLSRDDEYLERILR